MKTSIIFTSTSEHLADNLKKGLPAGRQGRNIQFIFPEKNKDGKRFFPDGEIYERISQINNLRKSRLIILHSGSPSPNDGLVELELLLQIFNDHGIKPEVFFTYFPYCRQDKIFELGETLAAESLVKKLVNYYKVKKIYIIDPHFGKMQWMEKYPICSVSAAPLLMEKAREDFGKDLLFMSPDKGGKRRTGILGLSKKRINSFEIKPFASDVPVRGKTVCVVDDIIGTGGTLMKFHEFACAGGAKKVIALTTHGVLDAGIQRIQKIFSNLCLTNTINRKEANVNITDLIIDTLKI